MAEIIQRDGTWAFDGSTLRITPGLHRSVPLFRQTYGEVAVPLEAVAGVVYEPERKRGRLRLRLREGADPLLQATGGRLPEPADPYRLTVDLDRSGVAEYVAEEIRHALLLEQIPKEPTKAYLLAGPPVPVSVRSSDGTVSYDGTQVRIDWSDTSDKVKRATGPRIIRMPDLVQVEWLPNSGYEDGFLRFVTRETVFSKLPPEKDPYALDLWGNARRDLLTALVATAVTARLPHPSTHSGDHLDGADRPSSAARPSLAARPDLTPALSLRSDHHDVLLRRLRELGELHRDGVLTDEEFAATKAAVLRGF
ncbi:DUF4429 domain-containing protein [Streptomyces cavernae]|uniref:DUF4429 domain-containing protein n=1 Tax=Streptomyces cavernae TaxID=2259034 RepID=UPI000FEB764A|nr:DUF4429 domain-containing protein [Streptomyces cavernae]